MFFIIDSTQVTFNKSCTKLCEIYFSDQLLNLFIEI